MKAPEVISAIAKAWARGDADEVFSFYAEDVILRIPGRSGLAGTHVGRAAVTATMLAYVDRTKDEDVAVEVLDVLVSDEADGRVALVFNEMLGEGVEQRTFRRVLIYRIQDDKILEMDAYEANQYAVDEFLE